jgi:hypothetical protein
MKIKFFSVLALSFGLIGFIAVPATAQAADVPTYTPPDLGAPSSGRVGGGTRGLSRGVEGYARLYALEPGDLGLTLQAQPVLYWALSGPVQEPIEITISHADPKLAETMPSLLETRIESPGAGIHALNLKDYKVSLEPGVEYNWFVSIVIDPKQRSKDVLAVGAIMRATADSRPAVCVADKRADQPLGHVYAECGVWYDSLAEVSQGIAANPADQALHQARVALLKQVDLADAAELDK